MTSDSANPASVPGLTLLLYELRSPINIGMILRLAETFGVSVVVTGSQGVLADTDKLRTVSDFACGALQRKGYQALPSAFDVAHARPRLIATSIEDDAIELPQFAFQPGDVVLLGNEYDGLPEDVAKACSARLKIPMADVWTPKPASHQPIDPSRVAPVSRDGMPNLNVAVAAGIICYQWFAAVRSRDQDALKI